MPNRVFTPQSPSKPPGDPSHPSFQPPSGYRAAEQKTAHSGRRKLSSPSNQSSRTDEKYYSRPRGPSRLSIGKGITTLERIWGPLFDQEGHPTVKLGQFLRGLALHIIEDYEPWHSMVITPKKMARYYEDVRLSTEVHSWATIFDCEHQSISRMYRTLKCQHHLVQERHDARPHIPGLTPSGFERWVIFLIQAYPEEEFEKLRKAVVEMPISNPDDKKERFPKEISRRLFPSHEDYIICNRIEDSIAEGVAVENHRRESQEETSPYPSPPSDTTSVIVSPRASQNRRRSVKFADQPITSTTRPTQVPPHFEYKRHSPSASGYAIDDTPSPPPSWPSYAVARDRKRDSTPLRSAERFQDGFGRIKPRWESFADPALRLGRTRSTSAAHPKPLNTNARRRGEGPQPGILFECSSASGASCHHRAPSSYCPSTDPFRQPDGDARGYEQTL